MEKVCVLRRRRSSIEILCSTVKVPKQLLWNIFEQRKISLIIVGLKKRLENKISNVFYFVDLKRLQFDPSQLYYQNLIVQFPLKFGGLNQAIFQ